MLDLNKADPMSYSVIPDGIVAKVKIAIQPGDYGDFDLLTKSKKSGSIGLNLSFSVIDGEYKNRKFFQLVGIEGQKDTFGQDKWGSYGKSLLRAIVESAKSINPKDDSEIATAKRNVKFSDFQDMECVIRIGVQPAHENYPEKNRVKGVITPEQKIYKEYMKGNSKTQTQTKKIEQVENDFIDNDVPF